METSAAGNLMLSIAKYKQLIEQHDKSKYRKSSAESRRLKLLGNEALKSGRLQNAFHFYNDVSWLCTA